jgi:hypothetical protein
MNLYSLCREDSLSKKYALSDYNEVFQKLGKKEERKGGEELWVRVPIAN